MRHTAEHPPGSVPDSVLRCPGADNAQQIGAAPDPHRFSTLDQPTTSIRESPARRTKAVSQTIPIVGSLRDSGGSK